MDREQLIKEIIENFDFEKVAKVMKFLDWTYWDSKETPSVGKLVISAQNQLSEAFDKCCSNKCAFATGTGGFSALGEYNKETQTCDYLELSFKLTSWEAYEEL